MTLPNIALSVMQPEGASFPSLDDGFGHWLAGFIDGEGCFFFHKRIRQFSPPQFQLGLRDDDREILEECIRRTGLGHMAVKAKHGPSKPQCKWMITKRDDCVALVAILDRFPLRAKKQRDFAIWRQAVALWAVQTKAGKFGGGCAGYPDHAQIRELQLKLIAGRAYASENCA